MAWRRILCETNVSTGVISKVQMSLKRAGYNPGPIDGVLGWRTTAAMKSYQKNKGLAVGELTYETIKSLGIQL
jgi:peptidoglycan hydrolase-like protein with peptidoglycan-binding domain